MYGALLGDIIGSPYEFDMGDKTKDFPLFCERSEFTDDSVMTIAVTEALMDSAGKDPDGIRQKADLRFFLIVSDFNCRKNSIIL